MKYESHNDNLAYVCNILPIRDMENVLVKNVFSLSSPSRRHPLRRLRELIFFILGHIFVGLHSKETHQLRGNEMLKLFYIGPLFDDFDNL